MRAAAGIVVALSLCVSACGRRAPEPREYELKGQIISVSPERQEVLVNHEDIPGFMAAMTMPYKVKDAALLEGKAPGDLFTATLVVEEVDAYLSSLNKTGTAPIVAPPAAPLITATDLLKDGDRVRQFLETAATLGPKLGALLFQLPPNLKKDLALFDAFLDTFSPRVCAAFEFRHASWLDEEIYSRLRARNLALCVADSEKLSTPVEITADYGYFRLRDEGYTAADIDRWAAVIQEKTTQCGDVFVYFKHEESGKGPEFGKLLIERLSRT